MLSINAQHWSACTPSLQAQQHQFNLPYQAASVTLNGEGVDSADDADVYGADLLPGDLLLLGTDGLFDNLFDYQLEALLAAQNLVTNFALYLADAVPCLQLLPSLLLLVQGISACKRGYSGNEYLMPAHSLLTESCIYSPVLCFSVTYCPEQCVISAQKVPLFPPCHVASRHCVLGAGHLFVGLKHSLMQAPAS